MRRDLLDELKRMRLLAYNGKNIINEQVLRSAANKPLNSPESDNNTVLSRFYSTLKNLVNPAALRDKNSVKTLQVALLLLGYKLPRYGADGMFGSETKEALKQFTSRLSPISEGAEALRDTINSLGYDEKGNELTTAGDISDEISNIASKILKDYKSIQPDTMVVVTSGNDMYHKGLSYNSSHKLGNAVDVVLKPYNSKNAAAFKSLLSKYQQQIPNFKFIDEYTNPSAQSTGGHFHLEFKKASNIKQDTVQAMITPNIVDKMISTLKSNDITADDINRYLAPRPHEPFTTLDLRKPEDVKKYEKICDTFISKYTNILGITGKMMVNGAIVAFNRYGKYIPPELALSQLLLEGGINNKNPQSRPIRTNNPFNVRNTDKGPDYVYSNVQNAINSYYNLIASAYLDETKGVAELFRNFVNNSGRRYASAQNYEAKLQSIAQRVKRIAELVA